MVSAQDAETLPDVPIKGPAREGMRSFDRLMTSFLTEHKVPGAAVAVARNGKLMFARGYGYADIERKRKVRPTALFRIASISKPITAVAILQLIERGKLQWDDKIVDVLELRDRLATNDKIDRRWSDITVLQLLQHTGGWDRDQSFDPISRIWEIAAKLERQPPIRPEHILEYMLEIPLDFDPGERYAYSNFGYTLLGLAIKKLTGKAYDEYVKDDVLKPIGVTRMQLGRALLSNRARSEVKYYDAKNRKGRAVIGKRIGRIVPIQYGADNLEGYDSHGGWIASAIDLVKFTSAFDDADNCPLLKRNSIESMWARPEGLAGIDEQGAPRDWFYGCGWAVRPVGDNGQFNTWHAGLIGGTSTLLVRRWDGLCWAVLFNTDRSKNGERLSGLIDPLLHKAADEVESWPEKDLFERYLRS